LTDAASGLPSALPVDVAQPWEQLDVAGHVPPAGRTASCINAQSEFRSGVEREQSSLIGVSENGEAVRLSSGDAGSSEVSWTYWRLTMGGVQPGAVSADVNVLPMSDDSLSEYYLGLSDYASGLWLWYGPFSENHVRLSTATDIAAGADFLSPLGNLYICAAASDGALIDVVGVAANPVEAGDIEAPPVPAGLSVTPIAGGLELSWDDVIAGDLAGYQVYWRSDWFLDQQATGLQRLGSVEGQSRHMLKVNSTAEVYLRVSAIDLSGNESDLSELAIAAPLPGDAPELRLTADAPSGMLNDTISLTATGADAYDWDLDGDGIYEVTGDISGTQSADTSATGMIRPAVRGEIGDGTAVALGSVSLLISGNARPIANGYADPSAGPAPLTVEFTGAGTDPDGEIVLYSWDFDGNGSYDWSSPTNSNPPDQVYNIPYLRNVKFRVDDDQGAYDVDTVAVLILDPLPGPNESPVADLSADRTACYWPFTINFDGSGSSDPDGNIVFYEWDFDGDGSFEEQSSAAVASYTFPVYGIYRSLLRVTDNHGAQATDTLYITLPTEWWTFGMEQTHNRRSPYLGPQTNSLKWTFTTGDWITCSPVIGADGTVYLSSTDYNFYAINSSGNEKWSFNTWPYWSTHPAVGMDGTVYFGCAPDKLYALNPDGTEKWFFTAGSFINSAPTIDADGTIYVGSGDHNFYAINPDGTEKWSFTVGDPITNVSAAISADGVIYVGCSDHKLYALYPWGAMKWSFLTGDAIGSSPAIGDDGTIYVCSLDHKLYAINPDGTEKWSFTVDEGTTSSPAIAENGTVYFVSAAGKLFAVTEEGSEKWVFACDDGGSSSPVIAADGTIYLGNGDKVYAVDSGGSEKWSYTAGGLLYPLGALSAAGVLYMGCNDGKLYAFR